MGFVDITPRFQRTLFLQNPLTGDDQAVVFFTEEEVLVSELRAVITPQNPPGSPSVTWTVRYAADRSAVGTEIEVGGRTSTNDTTGDVVTGGDIDNDTIPANSWVWLDISTATTGSDAPEAFSVAVVGRAR